MLAREVGSKELEGLALRARGELAAETMWDTSNPEAQDEAVSYFDKALVIFRSTGNEYEVARTLHAYGNRLLEKGDMNGGKELLEQAEGIFQKIQSKTGDKISRTIREIITQPAKQPALKKSRLSGVKSMLTKKKADHSGAIPDMTEDLESNDN